MNDQAPLFLDIKAAAAMLLVSEGTIRREIRTGHIPAILAGGQWRIQMDELMASTREAARVQLAKRNAARSQKTD